MFHVVTGGSGSGKSAFAEQCILDCQGNKRIYIATMYPFDEESHRRIARHRAMRAEKKFTTIERYTDLEHLTIPQGADVLLECMSNLTANEIYQEGGAGDNTVKAILNGIHHLLEQAGNLVVVTNEVFSDGITYDPETEKYLEKLGAINCHVEAATGAIRLLRKAHATIAGVGILIEKSFQPGRGKLIEQGIDVYSLARISKLGKDLIEFIPEEE